MKIKNNNKILIIANNNKHTTSRLAPMWPQPLPAQGSSGLQEHPKSSQLWAGMAILSILHNLYHDLLSKLAGDASSPRRGPELWKQASKLERDRMKWRVLECRDAQTGGTINQCRGSSDPAAPTNSAREHPGTRGLSLYTLPAQREQSLQCRIWLSSQYFTTLRAKPSVFYHPKHWAHAPLEFASCRCLCSARLLLPLTPQHHQTF